MGWKGTMMWNRFAIYMPQNNLKNYITQGKMELNGIKIAKMMVFYLEH